MNKKWNTSQSPMSNLLKLCDAIAEEDNGFTQAFKDNPKLKCEKLIEGLNSI